jgi:hypothetical protein
MNKKETAYSVLWSVLRQETRFQQIGRNDAKVYFGKGYILDQLRVFGYRWAMPHAKRYLNQFVANGTVSKKAGCYRIKAKYMNLVEPKPRVKVASELNRNRNVR